MSGAPSNADFGANPLTLVVTDAAGVAVEQSFSINVDNANDAPTFTSTPVASATEDIAYSYAITSTDPDAGDTRVITALSLPTWLVLTDNGDGTASLDGTPMNGNVGSASVVLSVTDALGASDNQSFTITVANANDAPAFTSTPVTAALQDITYTYNITTSDPDAGDTRAITATVKPNWLTFNDNGNGSATLSGAPSNADFGANPVTLVVTDAAGVAVEQSFSINVDNANDAPTFTSTPVASATEDIAYSYAITSTDPDAGDTRVITALSLPTWLVLTDNGDGTASLDGTPMNGNVGSASVVLSVTDALGASDNQSFTITVANANDAPAFTSTPVTAALQDITYTYNITTSDPDAGDTRAITATVKPNWLTFNDNGNGSATLSGAPSNADFGANPVTLVVTDAAGVAVEQSFSINVDNANDAPTFTSTPVASATEDIAYSYVITSTDPDAGDTRVITALSLPTWLVLTDNGDGTASLDGTPLNGDVGSASVVLSVTDALGASDNQSFTITVANANDAPAFTSTPVTAALQDITYTYNITTSDPDAGDTRAITATVKPNWLTFNDNGNGSATLSGAPSNADFGANPVTLVVTDAAGVAVEQSFSINVDNANDAPTFTSTPVASATEDITYSYAITSTDPDAGDTRVITALSLPTWLVLTDNGDGTASLDGTPMNGDVGSASVVLSVTDALGASDNQSFTITVANANDAPAFTSTPVTAALQDITYTYNITTSDPDAGDTRAITATVKPNWLTFNDNGNGTATLSGAPSNADFGANPVTLVVTDAAGVAVEQSFSINVDNANDAPTFTSTPVASATEDIAYSYAITSTDPDAGDTRVITALSLPTWLVLTDNGDGTASLDGTPLNGDVGSASVVLSVTDALGASDNQSFTIAVANANDAPAFTSTPVTLAFQDVLYQYDVLAEDQDVGDEITITASIMPSWLNFTSTAGSATITGTPTNSNLGDTTVMLTVTDLEGIEIDHIYNLEVKNSNDAPSFISIPETLVTEDNAYIYNVTVYDPDLGDQLITEALVLPSWMSFTDNGDWTATLQGTPENPDVGTHEVVLRVSDIRGLVETQSFNVTVNNLNDAPKFKPLPDTVAIENNLYSYLAVLEDVDAMDSHIITAVEIPAWASLVDHGDASATISGIPGNEHLGTDFPVVIAGQDSEGVSDTLSYTIKIRVENTPPSFNIMVSDIGVNEDETPIAIPLNAISPGLEANQALTFITTHDNPELITDITVDYEQGQTEATISVHLNENTHGTTSVTIRLEDDGPQSINYLEEQINISVASSPDIPYFVSIPDTLIAPNDPYAYQIAVADPDIEDVLDVQVISGPEWLTLGKNGTTFELSGTVPSQGPSFDVILEVSDGTGRSSQQAFGLHMNQSPSMVAASFSLNEDEVFFFPLDDLMALYSDPEDDPLHEFIIMSLPSTGTIAKGQANIQSAQAIVSASELGTLSFSAPQDYYGTLEFQVSATDGTSRSNVVTLTLNVQAVNDAPSLANLETSTIEYKQGSGEVQITESITINDIDDVSIQGAIVTITSGFTPDEDFLVFEETDSIASSYDTQTGQLLLTGSDRKSSYEAALQSISYSNMNIDDTNIETREISFQVYDMADSSNILARNIEVTDVKPDPDFVTAFTPNDDGVNDTWEIRNLDFYDTKYLYIYDKHGAPVYETGDPYSEWDGRKDGKSLPQDVYYYKLVLNSGERIFQGTVNILR